MSKSYNPLESSICVPNMISLSDEDINDEINELYFNESKTNIFYNKIVPCTLFICILLIFILFFSILFTSFIKMI